MLHNQLTLLEVANELQTELNTRNATKRRRKGDITYFPVDTFVLCKLNNRRVKGKLQPNWDGPMRVMEVSGDKYTLQDLNSTNIHRDIHVSEIKGFRTTEGMDPATLTEVEEDLYVVEEVIQHKLQNKKLSFLIKWEGYDDSRNSWEPLEGVQKVAKIQEYIRRNNLSSRRKGSVKE